MAAVRSLKEQNLRTVVLGFGADLASGDAVRVLNAMAEEGGMARSCGSCDPGESCDAATGRCSRRFYAARNADELARALLELTERIPFDPCQFLLDTPLSDAALVSIQLEDEVIPAEDWRYEADPDPILVVQGSSCERIRSAPRTAPVKVDLRVVYPL